MTQGLCDEAEDSLSAAECKGRSCQLAKYWKLFWGDNKAHSTEDMRRHCAALVEMLNGLTVRST